jgi:hypothetical protein
MPRLAKGKGGRAGVLILDRSPGGSGGGGGSSTFLSQPAWFVDPQNVSGNANDGNTGATALTPLLTKAELLRRIGAKNGSILVPMAINFLSEELAGQGTNDEIAIDTTLFSLVWTMPTTVVASGVLTAATPKNRAAGVAGRQTVSGPNINTNVGLIFEDTSFTPSAQAYIRASAGGTTAVICSLVKHVDPTPLNPFAGFANIQVDPVAVNTYRVLRPGRLNMAYAEAVNGLGGALVFVNAAFNGSTFAEQFIGEIFTAFCSFANFYIARVIEATTPAATNCFSAPGGVGFQQGPAGNNVPLLRRRRHAVGGVRSLCVRRRCVASRRQQSARRNKLQYGLFGELLRRRFPRARPRWQLPCTEW